MPPKIPIAAAQNDILNVLRSLRSRIRRYVVLEGAALVLVTVGATFWLSLSLDYWLEWSAIVRRLLLVSAMVVTIASAGWYLLLRLMREIRNPALAMILERRFPELNDRLITAVELCRDGGTGPSLSAAMLGQVANEAVAAAHRLRLREVFNAGPLLKAVSGAVLLLVSIVAFRFVAPETFDVWFRRNLLMADELYRRETDLKIVVLAEPGERQLEFKNGVYKHPRGTDFVFLAEVMEGKKTPATVDFNYRLLERSGGTGDSMIRIGERQFRQKIPGLSDSLRLWVRGGDYSTRDPLVVEVVDPPQIERISFSCLYPRYTGLNPADESTGELLRQPVPVLGAQVELPAGTDFVLEGRANKRLQSVQLVSETFRLYISGNETLIYPPSTAGAGDQSSARLQTAQPLLESDGMSFRVPLVLSIDMDAKPVAANATLVPPLVLPASSPIRIILHDIDDIFSPEPSRVTIVSKSDEPPQIESRLKGVSTSITRQATIPVVGDFHDPQDGSKVYGIRDDYGIASAGFEFKLDGKDEWQKSVFANSPAGEKTFVLNEKFKVLPLDLSIGQKFALKVTATDGDDLAGPHAASGAMYAFQIVSDSDLLAMIAARELNIRRRFEQIIEEVKNTQKGLRIARVRLEEARYQKNSGEMSDESPDLETVQTRVADAVGGLVNAIRKNATETSSIEQEFRDIRDELENNAVPDVKTLLDRIDDGIVRPLHSINTVDYNGVDDALVMLRKALDDKANPASRFDESVEQLNVTIEHLEAVLAQMLKLETVNEALQMLRDIIKSQEDLQEKTKNERKKKLIEGLK